MAVAKKTTEFDFAGTAATINKGTEQAKKSPRDVAVERLEDSKELYRNPSHTKEVNTAKKLKDEKGNVTDVKEKDDAGKIVYTTVKKKIQPCWKKNKNGTISISVMYGKERIPLDKLYGGKPANAATVPADKFYDAIDTLISKVREGFFDEELNAQAKKVSEQLRKKSSK